MPTPKLPYTAAFKQQMVELVEAGRGLKQLSREFSVSANSKSEFIEATWDEVHFETEVWTIPKERMKAGALTTSISASRPWLS